MTAFLSTLGLTVGLWGVAAVGTGAAIGLAWPWLRRRMADWHPADRESLLWVLASAPSLVPTALSLMLLAPGLASLALPGVDHCSSHPDHPHLCLVHPNTALPAFLAGLLLVGAFGLPWAARAGARVWREQRRMSALSVVAHRTLEPGVAMVESALPFAFTVGLAQARTLVSRGLVADLSTSQLEIVLAHESEHVRRRDPLRQLVARWLSVPLWPSLRRHLLSELELSAEQACDDAAGRRVGDRLAVAETILTVERLHAAAGRSPGLAGASIAGSAVAPRVEALLCEPASRRPRRWVWRGTALALALSLCARSFHHEAEHLIAQLLGLP